MKYSLSYVEGDLFAGVDAAINAEDTQTLYIAHVCNNQAAMGSGFVVPLFTRWPIVREKYIRWQEGSKHETLGHVQYIEVQAENPKIVVANMVAQTLGGERPLYYNHLVTCMLNVAARADAEGGKIIAPLFGAALAGGNWDFIHELIKDCWLEMVNVSIFYMPKFLPEGWSPPNDSSD